MPTDGLLLLDHHCHGVLEGDLGDAELDSLVSESYLPPPNGCHHFDSPLGLMIRRWCAPLLDLEPMAPVAEYAERRRALGAEEANRRLCGGARVSALLVDTGLPDARLCAPARLGELASASAHAVIRLEAVGEAVAATGVDAAGYADAFEAALDNALADAVAVKTVAAYRGGLGLEPACPSAADVREAAGRWLKRGHGDGGTWLLDDPVLTRYAIWTGVHAARERGLPLQVHAGFGDPDLTLHQTDPSLLTPLLRALLPLGVPVTLLHGYPYHRQAAYLAAMFPHVYVDVGLALNHVGPSAGVVLAEVMELTPFHKQLYSSDAVALAELHYLGALLFRRSLKTVLHGWLAVDDITVTEAEQVAAQIAFGNARRIYPLTDDDAPGRRRVTQAAG